MLVCLHCRQEIGVVEEAAPTVMIDGAEELIRQGKAARCPLCEQLVDIKTPARTFVPHYDKTGQKKICRNSGKPMPAPAAAPLPTAATPATASTQGTTDFIKVILCRRQAEPTIEALTLEYVDKSDRVRIQIDALREMLGRDFRMRSYPATLQRPDFAVWASATACVVGRKHPQGGIDTMTDAEILAVVEHIRQHRTLFEP
jgi:hypothetical protein